MKKINISQFASFGKYTKREKMVKQLKSYDVRDKRVLDAFLAVPRHLFLPDEAQEKAYQDKACPIGCGQTISQPYVVALMLEYLQLKPYYSVLEIGSGCGYVISLLSLLVKQVTGIELEPELAARSQKHLAELGIKNAKIVCANGYKGYEKRAPYDAILLSAAPTALPENLLDQLKPTGKLILPVGKYDQLLVIYEQIKGEWKGRTITDVMFVPLRNKDEN